eukprot:COSAG01_NODE_23997_length_794_cov_1.594245_1_plen_68_part_01
MGRGRGTSDAPRSANSSSSAQERDGYPWAAIGGATAAVSTDSDPWICRALDDSGASRTRCIATYEVGL